MFRAFILCLCLSLGVGPSLADGVSAPISVSPIGASNAAVHFPPVAVSVSTTTWNPSDKNSNITLSNGNLTATTAAAAAFYSFRGVASHSTGKFYYEVLASVVAAPALTLVGVANASASLSNFIGSDLNGAGYASGDVYINNGGTAVQTYAQGNTICIAVDLGAALFWVRTNGGNWNNSGTANPATGTGGISISSLNAGPFLPAATLNQSGDIFIANFGATGYAQTPPSGFGNW